MTLRRVGRGPWHGRAAWCGSAEAPRALLPEVRSEGPIPPCRRGRVRGGGRLVRRSITSPSTLGHPAATGVTPLPVRTRRHPKGRRSAALRRQLVESEAFLVSRETGRLLRAPRSVREATVGARHRGRHQGRGRGATPRFPTSAELWRARSGSEAGEPAPWVRSFMGTSRSPVESVRLTGRSRSRAQRHTRSWRNRCRVPPRRPGGSSTMGRSRSSKPPHYDGLVDSAHGPARQAFGGAPATVRTTPLLMHPRGNSAVGVAVRSGGSCARVAGAPTRRPGARTASAPKAQVPGT
jgi:hypothetical protein